MADIRLGIDLGTCYSSVGVFTGGDGVRFVKDPSSGHTSYSIPSSAVLTADSKWLFGERAESRKDANARRYCTQFKRDLGTKVPYELDANRVLADELTRHFLTFLVGLAAGEGTVAQGVVTVPAEYSERKRTIVRRAARAAGLRRVDIVDEPVAALAAFQRDGRLPRDGHVLVFDLGGGTFDAALIRLDDAQPTVRGTRGLTDFGGSDVDRMIERDFAAKAGAALTDRLAGLSSDDDAARTTALKVRFAATELCRRVKHELSYETSASGELLLLIPYTLTRAELETMTRPHLERTVEVCRRLLAEHQLTSEQLTGVVLVGGASRMPLVRAILERELSRAVWPVDDPELAVCTGAALLSAPSPTDTGADAAAQPSAEPAVIAPDDSQPDPDRPEVSARLRQDLLALAGQKELEESQDRARRRRAGARARAAQPQAAATVPTTAKTAIERATKPATKPATERATKPATAPATKPSTARAAKAPARTASRPAGKAAAASSPTVAPKAPPASRDQARLAERIAAEVKKLKGVYDGYECYCAPSIPGAKARRAREALQIPKSEKMLALLDQTFFGSARRAIVFTDRCFYYKPNSADALRIPYKDAKITRIAGVVLANGRVIGLPGHGKPEAGEVLLKVCALVTTLP